MTTLAPALGNGFYGTLGTTATTTTASALTLLPRPETRRRDGVTDVWMIGHSPSTRDEAPYGDPSAEFWTLNDAHAFLRGPDGQYKHIDRWFEIHSESVWRNPDRRSPGYVEFLASFGGPVYMREPHPDIPTSVAYPMAAMAAAFGVRREDGTWDPYLTSGFSYMTALALHEGFTRIHFVGADLMGEQEYIEQRDGFTYLVGVAQGRGVTVTLPKACPIMRGKLYGQNEQIGNTSVTDDEIANRLAEHRNRQAQLAAKLNHTSGALEEAMHWRARLGSK